MKSLKFCLSAFLVVVSCCTPCGFFGYLGRSFSMEYKYGQSFNAERKKREIPLLPEGWGVVTDKDSITWWEPDSYWNGSADWGDGATPASPKHYQKSLLIQSDTVIVETDIYLGRVISVQYKDGEAIPIYEYISITHKYHIDEIDNTSCSADVHTSNVKFINGECEKAIVILEQWGLTYP